MSRLRGCIAHSRDCVALCNLKIGTHTRDSYATLRLRKFQHCVELVYNNCQYKFTSDDHSTVRTFLLNGVLALFQFHSVSIPSFSFHFIPFCSHDIGSCYFPCAHKGSVKASFGAEDGLQLLHIYGGRWLEI